MKSNYKFYLGLSFGLLMGFLVFNLGSAIGDSNKTQDVSLGNADVSITGSWVQTADMQPQIDAYKKFITEKNLPENTSTGGFIKRTVLNDITGTMDGSYIKYSFYYDGEGKIGLYFQKEGDDSEGIRTGAAAFCPNMCNYPGN